MLFRSRQGLAVWPLLDASGPAILLGQTVGRLGCLANGDAWGAPCTCPWCLCVTYTHPNALLPDNLRRLTPALRALKPGTRAALVEATETFKRSGRF